MSVNYEGRKIMGYRRENRRVGVRNHVLILPLDDISNAACEAVANNIKGTIAILMPMAGFNLEKILSFISRQSLEQERTRMWPLAW